MEKVFFRPGQSYVGDVIPYYENGVYYLFFLNDRRKTDRTADQTAWGLVTTRDFVHYEDHGIVLPNSPVTEADNCCYTGCVYKKADGDYHLFYTAHNNDNPAFMDENGNPIQTVMHATSTDLFHWQKHPDRFGSDGRLYTKLDWRDPFVYWNPEEECYNMLLAARRQKGSFRHGGCVLKCRSYDLWSWEADEPLFNPEAYFAHECPDLFFMGGWWYLVYSTFTERFSTHYRLSRSINGPWLSRPQDTWDARAYYAAKTAGTSERRYAFGWIPTRKGRRDSGRYEWGGNLCVHELTQQSDGTLLVRMPETIARSFEQEHSPVFLPECSGAAVLENGWELKAEEKNLSLVMDRLPEQCLIEADLCFDPGIRHFGLALNWGDDLDDGYFFRLEPFYNRLVFDRWPRSPLSDDCQQQHYLGGDIPFQVELERPVIFGTSQEIHLQTLVEDDIAVCYVNHTAALSVRLYDLLKNRRWGFFAADGKLQVKNLRVFTRKNEIDRKID